MAKEKTKTFKKGVHFADNKYLIIDAEIEEMPLIDDYFIALSQHIGVPATPLVESGDKVAEGQLIAKAEGFVSANVYSPVSGRVVGIEKRENKFGVMDKYIHVKREGEEMVTLPPIDVSDGKAIADRIEEAGIVGLGGAGFPTHVKAAPKKPVDLLIVNAAEC